jgi:ribose 5-phosphate isomerase B
LELLTNEGHQVTDCGGVENNPQDDYPDFVQELAQKMLTRPAALGVVICRNGVGVSIAANRYSHLRAALGFNPAQVETARQDDNANILALGADYFSTEEQIKLVQVFINTPFSNEERHLRRLAKVDSLSH